jgi:hypothetical protein
MCRAMLPLRTSLLKETYAFVYSISEFTVKNFGNRYSMLKIFKLMEVRLMTVLKQKACPKIKFGFRIPNLNTNRNANSQIFRSWQQLHHSLSHKCDS